jgi:hypothetical protein
LPRERKSKIYGSGFLSFRSMFSAFTALKGDDYILHCHPEEQKVPRADRLREWYLSMLETAQRRGLVEKVWNRVKA